VSENAIRYAAIGGTVAAFAWWLYRHFAVRRISADSGVYIATSEVDGNIFIGAPEFVAPKVAHIAPDQESLFNPLEFISVTTKKIVQAISAWTTPAGEQWRPIFDAAERAYMIPSGLLFRQGYQESRFRQDIIDGTTRSSAGAVGIMQIIPKWHPELGEAGALDPLRAIPYAGKYLASLRKRFGTWELALAAYNAGPGNVVKYNGIPPFTETQNYVAQITADVPVSGVA
jgi:soluble lytic murein transglycosylase-like protein